MSKIQRRPSGKKRINRTFSIDPDLMEFIYEYAYVNKMSVELALENILLSFKNSYKIEKNDN